ncbi:hypothetical protein SDC9_181544 [bioreactor metagenome]|uniref:Uncharacterized protein n=1 Tax=bioreactor metagenome TaxID=1076179 RepID=A0A645H6T0_9ZZZZ
MIVNGNRKGFFRLFLSDDIFIEGIFQLLWFRQIIQRKTLFAFRVGKEIFVIQNIDTFFNALIADKNTVSGYDTLNLVLRFSAK